MKKKILDIIIKYRFIIALITITAMFGFTLYKLILINRPTIDEEYLRAQQSAEITDIAIDPKLKTELERLTATRVDTTPKNLGQDDPFNP